METENIYTKYKDEPEESRSDDFENLDIGLRWNRFSLRQLGIWPDPELFGGRSLRKYKFLFPAFFMLAFTIIPQTTLLVMVWGDLDLVVDNLCVANIPMFSALMKLLILRFNSKALRPVVACIIYDWKNVKKPKEREVLLKYGKIANIIFLVFTFLIYMTVISYVILQIYLNYTTKRINGTDTSRRLLYQSYFPYNTQVSPNYELTWLGQLAAAVYSGISFTGVDSLLAILALHVCSQYKNLQIDLTNVLENMDMYKEAFTKKLSTIVRKHNHLNRCADTIDKSFNLMLLVQMFASTVQLCFQGFQVLTTLDSEQGKLSPVQLLFLSCFLFSVMVNLYIYCYIGDKLHTESESMAYAAYQSQWYNLEGRDARVLLLVMLRANSPMQITAWKLCSFSMITFAEILKKSAAYLSVLLTVKDHK